MIVVKGGRTWPEGRRLTAWAVGCGGVLIGVAAVVLVAVNGNRPSRQLTVYIPATSITCAALSSLGALILRRHRGQPVGLLLVALGYATGISGLARAYVALGADGSPPFAAEWAYWLASFLWLPPYVLVTTLLLVVFPDGRPPSPRWWPLVVAIVAMVAVDTVWFAFMAFPTDRIPELAGLHHPLGVTGEPRHLDEVVPFLWLPWLLVAVASIAALVARLVSAPPLVRRQVEWFALGALLWLGFVIVDSVTDVSVRWPLLEALFLTFLPLGAAVGIVRHNLLDIDRVIHRGLVAAGFAGALGALYGATVVFAERLVGPHHDPAVSVVAVSVVALAVLPLWRGLDRGVERMLFGERAEPFDVLARLGAELDAAVSPEVLLERVAHSIAGSLRLQFVAVEVQGHDPVRVGEPRAQSTSFPLVHNGMTVGTLFLGHRSDREPFAAEERRLLDDLSRRLAATARAMQLASDLRRSREELVLAREEERRRIRHDLHDGLGPQLAGIGLQLDLAREQLGEDRVRVEPLLARAKDELSDAILHIRRVVDGLRPPALDELGLVGAIRQQVGLLDTSDMGGLQVDVRAADDLGPLPAAVEVAAFRIATEAANNAARHSGARACTIELRRCGALEVEIRDDGRGIRHGFRDGIGLVSLRDRAEELGGEIMVDSAPGRGTRVAATLPLA